MTSPSSTWTDENRSFLTGDNALYVAQLYASYLHDPSSVDEEWRQYFSSLKDSDAKALQDAKGPSWTAQPVSSKKKSTSTDTKGAILDSIRAIMLIRAYRA
ncbi:MAG: hypothetical protein HYX35_01030, partial [Proteobacteria bacterium]|nr:hypothetical protein [Pseudomonadota bacterium]